MKILVSGNAGTGKSTLSRKLSYKYNLDLYQLDKVVWKEGWKPSTKDEKSRAIDKILKNDSWVIDGVTKKGLSEADIVYFLDISVFRCLLNVIRRFIKNGVGTRPELPISCPEYIGLFKAIKIIFVFNKYTKPWLMDSKNRKIGSKFIKVSNYGELCEI